MNALQNLNQLFAAVQKDAEEAIRQVFKLPEDCDFQPWWRRSGKALRLGDLGRCLEVGVQVPKQMTPCRGVVGANLQWDASGETWAVSYLQAGNERVKRVDKLAARFPGYAESFYAEDGYVGYYLPLTEQDDRVQQFEKVLKALDALVRKERR